MTSVYRKVLGGDFNRLAAELQYFHSLAGRVELSGRVSIKGPHRAAGRWMAWLFGLPKTTPETCFRFELDSDAGQETWRRYFPGRPMVSRMRAGAGVLVERFGPIKFHFRLTADEGRLQMRPQAVTVFGVPLPRLMMPTVTAEETGADGKLHFIVAVHLPLVGLLAEYRGYLDVEKNPNVVPAKAGIHALHEFPPCHLSVVKRYAATSTSTTGYGFPPARERRCACGYECAGAGAGAGASVRYAAVFTSGVTRRCSTKIGCAHGMSFFFLLVMRVSSDGS